MLVMLALGCSPVEPIRGTLGVGPGTPAPPAAEATLLILDRDLERFDSTVTDADGAFELDGPRGERVYAEVSGRDYARAGFVGHVGQEPFEVPDGALFAWSLDELDALHAAYQGCANVGEGGVIHGQVRLFGATDDETGEAPTVAGAYAHLETDGAPIEACYLDDDGVQWLPDAPSAGPTGKFAIFGVEPGIHTLRVAYTISGVEEVSYLDVYVPPDGIAPLFPTWIDLIGS